MRLVRRSLVALVVLLSACTPTLAGPPVPRPAISAAPAPTTTTIVESLSTADGADTDAPECSAALCLVYHIDPHASWADGGPVTADDLVNTADLNRASTTPGASVGYSLIGDMEVIDDKTLRVELTARHGQWRDLFKRVIRSGDTGTSVQGLQTSGPFQFVEWEEGDHLTVARDLRWWSEGDPISGADKGGIARITFVFIEDLEARVDALEAGEVDVIVARPDAATVERLNQMDDVGFTLAPGPFWEHIDFQHDDPVLASPWVRRAIALAIDREEILDRTIRRLDPGATTLDNTVWMSNSTNYEPHFPIEHDPAQAEEILTDNGCEMGGDGVYVCEGNRMSFVWASTNDDPDRAEIFDSVREDLAEVGIEIVGDFRSPSAFVTRDFLFGGPERWQMVNFSWRAWPDPAPSNATYYCADAGDLNVNRYCSEEVESLIGSTSSIVDPAERAAVYNQADQLYLGDLAAIPLYQKPDMIAWRGDITGPQPNFGYSSDLWNISSWTGPSSIVVALAAEPTAIDALATSDEAANLILGTLLYGAHGMTPSLDYVPVLVDSIEVIEGRS